MRKTKKLVGLVVAMALLVGVSIMGTLAYLTSQQEVINTFSVGNVAITLNEAEVGGDGQALESENRVQANAYHLMPGKTYDKDPTVHINAQSEDCYVFVKLENGLKDIIDSSNTLEEQMNTNGWTIVPDEANIYQRATSVSANDNCVVFENLVISKDVTVEELAGYSDDTIKITACAIQAEGFADVAEAAVALPAEFTGK